VITRDPRDLAKENTWCHRGGGSASYFLLGDVRTGMPLGGVAYAHRPAGRALCDPWGRLYVPQQLEGMRNCLGIQGSITCGFSVCDSQMKPILGSSFAPEGRTLSMALQGNLLVIGGYVESGRTPAGPQKSAVREKEVPAASAPAAPPQGAGRSHLHRLGDPKPGGGKDGLIVILRLWTSG
jgi:hypothetical protein